jgi:hypothetical protein
LMSGNIVDNAHWMVAFITASVAFALTLVVAWRALVPSRSPAHAITAAA